MWFNLHMARTMLLVIVLVALLQTAVAPNPTRRPTPAPTMAPSYTPGHPTPGPTPLPTYESTPSPEPTVIPTQHPTSRPSGRPTSLPTVPTSLPSASPTHVGETPSPTEAPTHEPTAAPTEASGGDGGSPSPGVPTFAPTTGTGSLSTPNFYEDMPIYGQVLFTMAVIFCGCGMAYLLHKKYKERKDSELYSDMDDDEMGASSSYNFRQALNKFMQPCYKDDYDDDDEEGLQFTSPLSTSTNPLTPDTSFTAQQRSLAYALSHDETDPPTSQGLDWSMGSVDSVAQHTPIRVRQQKRANRTNQLDRPFVSPLVARDTAFSQIFANTQRSSLLEQSGEIDVIDEREDAYGY